MHVNLDQFILLTSSFLKIEHSNLAYIYFAFFVLHEIKISILAPLIKYLNNTFRNLREKIFCFANPEMDISELLYKYE